MTPQEFIQKWTASILKERSAAQEHFIDLCRLLGQKTPADADPDGTWYCFEKGAEKYGGGDGFADVWMRKAAPSGPPGGPAALDRRDGGVAR
jgi:hypothetical protein